jgi:hypothetical protein
LIDRNRMEAFIYVLFGALLAFLLIALMLKPRWYRTGGFRPDLGPYVRHGGGPYRPGILY